MILRFAFLSIVLLLASTAPARAGIPPFFRVSCEISGSQENPCQWRFRATGDADEMFLDVTLRDAFDTPIASCSLSVTVSGDNVCDCRGSLRQTAFTDAAGAVRYRWACLGGYGDATMSVTAHCAGDIGLCDRDFTFTSPDLSATCNDVAGPSTGGNVDVIDLGIWAGGLLPYQMASDFNCDGTVNVIDLGFLATGLSSSCVDCPPSKEP